MTIGERIKKIWVFRKMTMDELGGAITRQSLITALVLLKISLKHFSGLKKVPHHFLPVEKVQDSQSTQLPAT